MPKLLQVSVEVNANSVGKIAEQIGETAIKKGWESYIAYARDNNPSKSHVIKIESRIGIYWHVLMTRLFDRHCLYSTHATKKLIKKIKEIDPDVIHLHHLHGYYLNMVVLFKYLKNAGKPVVWTFHDCWSFTGHCAYPNLGNCDKWVNGCHDCTMLQEYPKSICRDRSKKNWNLKKDLFTSVDNITIVPVSDWMKDLVAHSFLKKSKIQRIYNGVDLNTFLLRDSKSAVYERYGIPTGSKVILGAASTWEPRKGLSDFIDISSKLPSDIKIVLVGLSDEQLSNMPPQIIGIKRTYNVHQMAELYSAADIFVNPTYGDTFPTTNLEALACGTPVITYRTGGSTESVDKETGIVVEQGDKEGLKNAIINVLEGWNLERTSQKCRQRAELLYDKKKNYNEYIELYDRLIR